jgi:hypothetical protein
MNLSQLKDYNDRIEYNLCKFKELKDISPSEAEKYREIARKLVKETDNIIGIT